jgi:hypothetical protein
MEYYKFVFNNIELRNRISLNYKGKFTHESEIFHSHQSTVN